MNTDKLILRARTVVVALLALWFVAWYAVRADRRQWLERNALDRFVLFLHEIPDLLEDFFLRPEEQKRGVSRAGDILPIGRFEGTDMDPTLYLLHYRYLGDDRGEVVLQNIRNGERARRWPIALDRIGHDLDSLRGELEKGYREGRIPVLPTALIARTPSAIRIEAPLMTRDSGLFFIGGSFGLLYRIDHRGRMIWKSSRIVHHSVERDGNGNVWTCSMDFGTPEAARYGFRDDAVLCLSPEGNELFFRSLSALFRRNGLFDRCIGSVPGYPQPYGLDPYHLNDVLPVLASGSAWRSGDVFLSLRNQSMLVLYRPGTDSVLWFQRGPWLAQHDVQVLNDTVISVFNNNTLFCSDDAKGRYSNIALFDFSDGLTTFFADSVFSSATEGRQTRTSSGETVVEATNNARFVVLNASGRCVFRFYIPYYSDSASAMHPAWARVYRKDRDRFLLQ